jgi:hypothetical protein
MVPVSAHGLPDESGRAPDSRLALRWAVMMDHLVLDQSFALRGRTSRRPSRKSCPTPKNIVLIEVAARHVDRTFCDAPAQTASLACGHD